MLNSHLFKKRKEEKERAQKEEARRQDIQKQIADGIAAAIPTIIEQQRTAWKIERTTEDAKSCHIMWFVLDDVVEVE